MTIVLCVLLLLMAIFLTVAVLMQHGKSHNLSGTIAGGAETFFGKTKGRSMDAMLSKITTIVAIIFVILVIVVYVLQPNELIVNEVEGANTDNTVVIDGNTTTDGTETDADENGDAVVNDENVAEDGTQTELPAEDNTAAAPVEGTEIPSEATDDTVAQAETLPEENTIATE